MKFLIEVYLGLSSPPDRGPKASGGAVAAHGTFGHVNSCCTVSSVKLGKP